MFGGGRYRAALAAGRPVFTGIDATTITWPDGSAQQADVILLATGCRPELGYPAPWALWQSRPAAATRTIAAADPCGAPGRDLQAPAAPQALGSPVSSQARPAQAGPG